jgi:hypothetical protein
MVVIVGVVVVVCVTSWAATRAGFADELTGIIKTVGADALATTALSLSFNTTPHLFGHAEALAAASLVARAGIGTS